VAVPHVYLDAVSEPVVLFVRLSHGVNMGAPDGIPTRFVFFLVGPPSAASEHLDTLATIARVGADDEFRYEAADAASGAELAAALDHFIARTSPERPTIPTRDEPPEGLRWTGRPLGGVIGDAARRYAHYAADLRDGLHPKCLASVLFLFFACTAPTVIFGGIMAAKTGGQIGVVEMIIATSIGGCLYALFSGQPLVILGGTGPLLVFISILYQGCVQLEVDFLTAYAWVGLWTGLFVLLLAAVDASCLMRFFTRFTDESFSALISLIFIYEAVSSLIAAFTDLEGSQQHATALLTLLLALGTFYLAMTLTQFRRSSFLRPYLREFLADFGPTIALALMTWAAFQLDDVPLDRLAAPTEFGPTADRSWLVDLAAAPAWLKYGAALPALFGAVLVFLDQNITARLVNSRDHRLQRGPGYHLDLAIVGGLV
ncbi:MAG: PTS sugar transporter subunit IIA, partial [Planctomycetota bacterium]